MTLANKQYYLPFLVPILIVIGMFCFVNTGFFMSNQDLFSKALIIDLLIGIPVLYFLLIRKTTIPKKSVLKIFTLCLFISTFIIPTNNLAIIKLFVFPLVKIWIGYTIIKKLIFIWNEYRRQSKELNGYILYISVIKRAFLGKFGDILSMEFSVLYFLFARKKVPSTTKFEFGYIQNKGTVEMVIAFIFIIAIETVVAHILIAKWSPIVAFISSYGSVYLIFLFISILKSRSYFPISIEDNVLDLKYGYVNKSIVKIEDIESIEVTSRSNIEGLMKLSAFKGVESHNIILYFKHPQIITKVFGIQKEYSQIGIYVDDRERFIQMLAEKDEA